jgi:phage tail-like protein
MSRQREDEQVFSKRKIAWLSLILVAAVVATSGISVALAKGPASPPGPPHSNQMVYTLDLQDIWSEFSTISGLGAETEVIEYQDGEDPILRKRPGRTRIGDLVLSSDLTNPALDDLWNWYGTVTSGRVERKSGTITLSNGAGEVLDSYAVDNAWPCSWQVITASDSGGTFIQIGLAVEWIERQQ